MSFKIVVNDNKTPNKVIVQDNIVQVIVQSTTTPSSNVYINQPKGVGPGGDAGPMGTTGNTGPRGATGPTGPFEAIGTPSKNHILVYDSTSAQWVSSNPSIGRAALGFGEGTGGTLGVSGDILIVNAPGTTLEYTRGYVKDNFAVTGLSCDGGATFGSNVNIVGSGNYISFPDGTTMGTLTSGPVGATGATGSDGAAGSQGIQGVTGNTGPSEEIIGISVNNGSQVLTTGKKGHRILPYDCEVIEWTVTSSDSGSIEWDINWCTYANWPTTASVGGPSLPQLDGEIKQQDTSINWTKTTFDAGNIIEFEVDDVATITNCSLSIKIRKVP